MNAKAADTVVGKPESRTKARGGGSTVSVAEKVKNLPVRYSLGVGRISIVPKDKRLVQLQDGTFERIEAPGLRLECEGEYNQAGVTRQYDPTVEADAAIIRQVDEWIASGHKNAVENNVRKLTVTDEYVEPPMSGWFETKPAKLLEVMKLANLDLEQCMKYEMKNPNTGGPRLEVVNAIEGLAKQRAVEADSAKRRGVVEADVEF